MKTLNLILTILALAIQAMVYGQTQGNQAHNKNVHVTTTKFYPVLGKSEFGVSYTEESTEKKEIAKISPYNKSLSIKGNLKDANELSEQAAEMQEMEAQLRAKLAKLSGAEKQELIKQINELVNQTELVMIQSSEIKGKITVEIYEFNKEIYQALLNDPNVNDNYIEYSSQLNMEAEKLIKLAKELRQEAYAMPSNASKLGSMMNAEEKEHIAISKQKEAIDVLNKISTPVMANN